MLPESRVPESATAFGIYVHWPFCAAKCPYCDFNSHVRHAPPDEARFVRALVAELTHFAARTPGRGVTSVFFGGGTPSLLTAAGVGALLDAVARLWPVAEEAEITLEANPGSADAARFAGYRAAGVNRLSLGVQALDDPALRALGRIHDAATARRAIALARATFPRLSFDLIYARPRQTLRAWESELLAAIALAADHLSLYQLTIEPETPFARLHAAGRLAMPDADTAAAFYERTAELTEAAGLPAYEVSNHARPGAEARHNLTYWRAGEYVGVGPGAHGRIDAGGKRRATMTEAHPERWLTLVEAAGHGLVADEALDREACADEMLLMGLRLAEGVSAARYAELRGRELARERLAPLLAEGLVERRADGRLSATLRGRLVLNSVIAALAA